jgi:D-alanyl-D-alanine carboxypeptidase/D-alanyl-D-alanine-endopeptidase (penicillin-binding protein 4)
MNPIRFALLLIAFAAASPALATQPALQQRVAAELAEAPTGTRFGLMVTDESGRELIAIQPDGRFIPASNVKLLTTATAYAALGNLDQPDAAGGASVRLEGNARAPDVILTGRGDARMSSAPDCVANCLAALADAVAARTRRVRDVIGDDSLLPDQRWAPGVSWEDLQERYGTAVSALSLDDNELVVRVSPGAVGSAPAVEAPSYLQVQNRAVTVVAGPARLQYLRLPGSRTLQLSGTIVAGAAPQTLRLGIDDPAYYAAWRLQELLAVRGVKVIGRVAVRHSGPGLAAPVAEPAPLARLLPPPLSQDVTRINKESQNLHADLLLRRIGRVRGAGHDRERHRRSRIAPRAHGRAADRVGPVGRRRLVGL